MLRLPELAGARLARFMERPGANHRPQFLRDGRYAPVEIRPGLEGSLRMSREQPSSVRLVRSFTHTEHYDPSVEAKVPP